MHPPNAARTQQRQLHKEYTRLRSQAFAGYRELPKRVDELTADLPRRAHHHVHAVVQLWKARGSQHVVTFLGPTALAKPKLPGGKRWQSESSHKRAKREVLDVWRGPQGQIFKGRGLLKRVHVGGGRLARKDGGGKNSDGRFKGNADGVMPGPELLGWSEDQYRRAAAGPPVAPPPDTVLARDPGESASAHRDREQRLQTYLESRGLKMADGP